MNGRIVEGPEPARRRNRIRGPLVVGVLAASLVVPAGASANGNGNGGNPNYDFVVGSTVRKLLGDTAGQKAVISAAARSGPSGQNPQGLIHVVNTTRKTVVTDVVRCLRVEGKLATAGVTVIKSNDPLLPKGTNLHWWFADNGPAALRKDGAFSTPIGSVVDPTVCPQPVDFTRDDIGGGYLIHDAQP